MNKVKITVLKRTFHKELAEQYAASSIGPCEYTREGMTFVCANGWQKPEGLCDTAWKALMEYVFALAHGGGDFFGGEARDPKKFVVSCSDGFRPVSFLVEALDEEGETLYR